MHKEWTSISSLARCSLAVVLQMAEVLLSVVLLGLTPAPLLAIETDRITVEDSVGMVKFRVTTDGNVTGTSFTGFPTDGAAWTLQQGPTEGGSAVKLNVKNSVGASKASVLADGTINASKIVLPIPVGTARDLRITNVGLYDSQPTMSIYPDNGINAGPSLQIIPRGTGIGPGTKAQVSFFNTDYVSDANNYEVLVLKAAGTSFKLTSSAAGSGTLRPINFMMNTTAVLSVDPSNNVGIATTTPTQKLEINGGIRMNPTTTAKPTCSTATGGTFWFTKGGAGVKDAIEVCAKDSAESYAWRLLW